MLVLRPYLNNLSDCLGSAPASFEVAVLISLRSLRSVLLGTIHGIKLAVSFINNNNNILLLGEFQEHAVRTTMTCDDGDKRGKIEKEVPTSKRWGPCNS